MSTRHSSEQSFFNGSRTQDLRLNALDYPDAVEGIVRILEAAPSSKKSLPVFTSKKSKTSLKKTKVRWLMTPYLLCVQKNGLGN
jgi:hypothetical protein